MLMVGCSECCRANSPLSSRQQPQPVAGGLDHRVFFFGGEFGCDIVGIIVVVGNPLWWAATDRKHDRAVGSKRVVAAVEASPNGAFRTVFLTIVQAAPNAGVRLIGSAQLVPLDRVVNLAERDGHVAAGMFAPLDEQLCCIAGSAGEDSLGAAHVDRPSFRSEYHPAGVARQRSSQNIGRSQRHAVGRDTSPLGQCVGTPEQIVEQIGRLGQAGERIDRRAVERCRRTKT